MEAAGQITRLLARMAGESGESRKVTYDEVVSLVYADLRRRARQHLRGERADSLRPTILVHEAYERLLRYRMPYQNRQHFLNVAATAMRRFLIERARRISAQRRGGRRANTTLDVDTAAGALIAHPELLIDIDRALGGLRAEQVTLTELRFFAGFTIEETADIMGLNVETAKKRWRVIKVLLARNLEQWHADGR